VKNAVRKLIGQRYLLEEDLEPVVAMAAEHYDLFTNS